MRGEERKGEVKGRGKGGKGFRKLPFPSRSPFMMEGEREGKGRLRYGFWGMDAPRRSQEFVLATPGV